MDLNSLKSFAIESRRQLLKNVSFKIEYVLSENSTDRRENPKAIIELENKIKNSSKQEVIEEVSYTWFNRFTALQYMDINALNDVQVIMPSEGKTRPEILSNAISGIFDNNLISENTKNIVSALLDGRSKSNNPEKEAYRLLLVSVCNRLHSKMPFLFERIADYSELLIPDDILSNSSILIKIQDVMTKDNCQDVEVIGWLYQFYISDKKDEVFASLKKNKKISPENIPAATQLFTPHWIVKYLVENSLGRLWMLNNPNSNLINFMEYYIPPEESEQEFLKINSPTDLKIIDPACGSGHLLTYSFDLLYAIYKEEGYDPSSIPKLILKNNLYGIEIDKRAGQISAFALIMKAFEKDRKSVSNISQPNICILEKIKFETHEINDYMNAIGRDLFNHHFETTLKQFEESDNFGSLIKPALINFDDIKDILIKKDLSTNIFLNSTHNRVLKVLRQSDYLSQKYHILIANPPYMGSKGMNNRLSDFARKSYPDSKNDLFSMFLERSEKFLIKNGLNALVTMESWMFLSSFEKLRKKILSNQTINSMVHMPYLGKGGTSMGINFGTSAFVISKNKNPNFRARYCCVRYFETDNQGIPKVFPPLNERLTVASSNNFTNIPGSPICYWIGEEWISIFRKGIPLRELGDPRQGMATSDNNKFLRLWWEIETKKFKRNSRSKNESISSNQKWYPYNKGGKFRKWYGNCEFVVNWERDGLEIKNYSGSVIRNENYYFKTCISWSKISTKNLAMRFYPNGFLFDVAGCSIFSKDSDNLIKLLGFSNSIVAKEILKSISPTLNFEVGHIASLPILNNLEGISNINILQAIDLSKEDWNENELSWEFKSNSLFNQINNSKKNLKESFKILRKKWEERNLNLKSIEEKINNELISAYKLESELKEEVELKEVSLNSNPRYRYGDKISIENAENNLLQDTLKEFISYSVGCMFGRYSLDENGLIIANQGEDLEDYLKRVPEPQFMPDDDNVIPILDLDWFEDDISGRFKKFLKITFGDENFEENLRFIEISIGKDIRKYFLSDFYKDHIQRYKNRPVYWMFSSPKGSFNALIYLHRYQRDTVSILLEKYLREFLLKLRAEKNTLERLELNTDSSSAQKTNAMKEIQKIDSIILELQKWEKEVIFPLASQRLKIDLDDGVKINYPKFGKALKRISGLN